MEVSAYGPSPKVLVLPSTLIDTGQSILSMAGHGGTAVNAVAFSPCGQLVASCGDDGFVHTSQVL